jgi:UDP-glucose 4-epimerase
MSMSRQMCAMNPSIKKICVTGGAGFIGSHVVDRLLDENYEVIVIDDLSTGKLENLRHNFGREGFQFMNCDLRHSKLIRGMIKEVDAIFHEAALTDNKTSIRNPALTNSINVDGTLKILEAALDSDVKRFIYASSAAVYGNSPLPQSEDTFTKPISPYGVSKLAAENYVNVFNETHGFESTCLRYFNVYGPRQSKGSQYSGVITEFIERLLRNRSLHVHGDGKQSRDFIHVDDVVEANMLVLESKKALGGSFNVGTGKSTSINELLTMLLKMIESNAKIVHTKPRRGDIRHSLADITKIQEVLGFHPRHTLKEGLSKLVESYRKSDRRCFHEK